MTAVRMALSELRRLTSTSLGKAALLALALVPTLYAGLYLYANHDPYANLRHVPAAIVVEDRGTTLPGGSTLQAGEKVAGNLVSSKSFDWHRVALPDAESGVRRGTYDFAIVIPPGFSAAFGATANYEPTQAQLRMVTNDANSYLATSIADKVAGQVRQAIAASVGQEAASTFLTGLSSVRSGLVSAADGAGRLSDGLGTAKSGAGQLVTGTGQLASGATRLSDGLHQIATKTTALPGQVQQLADGARQVAAGDAKIATAATTAGKASTGVLTAYDTGRADLQTRLTELNLTPDQQTQILSVYDSLGTRVRAGNSSIQDAVTSLNRLADGAAQVADGTTKLANGLPTLVSAINSADTGASQLATGATRLADGAKSLDTGLGTLQSGATELSRQLRAGADKIPASDDQTRTRLAQTIGDPVKVSSTSDATAGSYGAGLAPFFLPLAAWIGGYVLFTQILPLSRRAAAANQKPLRMALGGWLAPALVGAAQMTLALTVIALVVRIVPRDIPATLGFLILASAVFVAIVQALCAWFGLAGQFLGLVLMVLQLITAGGTFPWQTLPQPLYPLHHLLPMSYAVDGMRQLMYGGLSTLVWRDVAVLAAWFTVAVLATSRAARRQRRWTPLDVVLALGRAA